MTYLLKSQEFAVMDIFTFERPCQIFCFYDVGHYFLYWKTCTITKLGMVYSNFNLYRFLNIKYIKTRPFRIKYSHKILNQLKERKEMKTEKNFPGKILGKQFKKENFLMVVFRWSLKKECWKRKYFVNNSLE